MSVDRVRLRERIFERKRARNRQDVCDLIEPGLVSDGMSGQTIDNDPDPIAENVDCLIAEISGGNAQIEVNGVTVIASHSIQVKTSAPALALTPHGTIRVHPRGDKGQRIFEQPVRSEEPFSPIIEFKAIFVKEGYRQPGII